MKNSYLALICGVILVAILAMSWCGRKPGSEVARSPTPALPVTSLTPTPSLTPLTTPAPLATSPALTVPPSATPAPAQTPTAELRRASTKVGPAVILVTTFDASGRLLRTGTGFFATNDGRLITNWHIVQDAAYGVAKSADGKIRNVTGILASSAPLDLAVLKAETKVGVPYARISKTAAAKSLVALVGSSLAKRDQPLGAIQITGRESGASGDTLATSVPISTDASGAPIVDENGEVVGVVTSSNQPNQSPATAVRPADELSSLLGQTGPDSEARWAVAGTESPTPTATPKPKVVYNPLPNYPDRARSFNPPLAGSGRFRITFDGRGQARQVQIVRSTGQAILDQAAVDAFQKWKSTPGHEWSLVVPITFQPR